MHYIKEKMYVPVKCCWHLYYFQIEIVVAAHYTSRNWLTGCVFYSPIPLHEFNGTTQTIKHEECRLGGRRRENILKWKREGGWLGVERGTERSGTGWLLLQGFRLSYRSTFLLCWLFPMVILKLYYN